MPSITKYPFLAHLRADPNEFILHFRSGKIARRGPGLSYWFSPLSAAIASVPVEDRETTFVLNERTRDFQPVAVQVTLIFRIVDAERAAARTNFTINLSTGKWIENPLERLTAFWSQRARPAARSYLQNTSVDEAVRRGADVIGAAMLETFRNDPELPQMGLAVVALQINHAAPSPELQKSLETPTRESIQQKADEAVFQRRALAVEKERAIKENEVATEIELARKQELLIKQQGANKLLDMQTQAEADKARIVAETERDAIIADGYARTTETRAEGDAKARLVVGRADADVQAALVDMWKTLPADVLFSLAMRDVAGKIDGIQHLNITPDLVGEGLQRLLRRQAEK